MKCKLTHVTMLSLLVLFSQAIIAEPWDKKFYNPKELEGDVVLPMPCEGTMIFRMVKTGSHNLLGDKAIVLGSESAEQKFAEYATPNYISGSFSEKGERYFLMSKYEITQLQYQAVMNESCPKAEIKARFPVTNVSWFDAVAFSNKYSEWLLKNHADKLPKEDNKVGFVRLPTNTEWEYAARGGAAVSDSEFRERLFPMTESSDKYIWSTKNANGKLQLAGQLNPNSLGLFDMLGNVNEMTFDAFRANKLDRYHGQSGGITVRGGSYLTGENQMSSAYRIEQPYYNDNGEGFKAKDTGFRVVFVTPIITSNNRLQQISNEWQALGKDNKQDQEIVANLEKIAQGVENKELKNKLKSLEDALRASNQHKDEQRDQAVRSALQLGAFLCTDVSDLNKRYTEYQKRYDTLCSDAQTALAACPDIKIQTHEAKDVRDFVLTYYADTLVETAQTYPHDIVKKQIQPVISKLQNQNKSNLNQYVDLYAKHLADYYKTGKIAREVWLQSCNELRK